MEVEWKWKSRVGIRWRGGRTHEFIRIACVVCRGNWDGRGGGLGEGGGVGVGVGGGLFCGAGGQDRTGQDRTESLRLRGLGRACGWPGKRAVSTQRLRVTLDVFGCQRTAIAAPHRTSSVYVRLCRPVLSWASAACP